MFGTPDEVRAKLAAVRDAGVGYIIFAFAGGLNQLRLFARDLMPDFAGEPVARAAE